MVRDLFVGYLINGSHIGPTVKIVDGGLEYDPDKADPSSLLHEAGHLATMPGRFRHLANGNLSQSHRQMIDQVDFSNPDADEARAAMQCSDPEATAWAWAAGKHLDVPDHLIIMDHEYDGSGQDIRSMLQMNAYLGIHGLAAAKFCIVRDRPHPLPVYPKLAMWLQPTHSPEQDHAHKPNVLRRLSPGF